MNRAVPIALAAISGAAVAVGAVYLLTGERGEETRQKLREWRDKLRDLDAAFDEEQRYDRIR